MYPTYNWYRRSGSSTASGSKLNTRPSALSTRRPGTRRPRAWSYKYSESALTLTGSIRSLSLTSSNGFNGTPVASDGKLHAVIEPVVLSLAVPVVKAAE